MKKIIFKLLPFISVLFFSCSDISFAEKTSDNPTKYMDKTIIFTGSINAGNALPQEILRSLSKTSADSRSAIPTVSDSVSYYAKATAEGRETIQIDDTGFSEDKKGLHPFKRE
jgi:hypothetical protein